MTGQPETPERGRSITPEELRRLHRNQGRVEYRTCIGCGAMWPCDAARRLADEALDALRTIADSVQGPIAERTYLTSPEYHYAVKLARAVLARADAGVPDTEDAT